MLNIDLLGLLFTVLLIGPRYGHYVILASALAEAGRVGMTLFLHAHVIGLDWAGLFGGLRVHDVRSSSQTALILFSGPLVNYIISACNGGISRDGLRQVLNPFAPLTLPFAVINFRLAVIAGLCGLFQIFLAR